MKKEKNPNSYLRGERMQVRAPPAFVVPTAYGYKFYNITLAHIQVAINVNQVGSSTVPPREGAGGLEICIHYIHKSCIKSLL